MKRLKWMIPTALLIILIAAGLFFLRGKDFSTGYCVVADNNSRLIVLGRDPVRLSNRSNDDHMLYKYDTGDKLLVLHDGIQETYPGATGAYLCIKIGEGSAKDIPDEVFTGLYELGWLSKAYLEEIGVLPPAEVNTPDDVETNTEEISHDTPYYAFDAQYIRTNTVSDGAELPSVSVLNTYDELQAYIEENRAFFDLDSEFTAACARYDEGYFLRQNLILIRLEEGSGSNRHEITEVFRNDSGSWQINIDRITPEVGTCDMAQWHILLEIQMGKMVSEGEDIDLVFDSFTPVTFEYGPYVMTLDIPSGWEYEHDAGDEFRQGLRFRPAGETEGWVGLYHYPQGFGVCGTGLDEHELRLTNGFKGRAGFYDGSPNWSYITINGIEGYVFNNDGALWLTDHRDEVFGIIASIDPTMIVTCVAPD